MLQACADQRTEVTEYQLGDTLVVESLRPIILDTLELREVDRIGQFDGPPEYLRPRYGDGRIRFHSDGTLWSGVHPATRIHG